jgi:hypothetical protein
MTSAHLFLPTNLPTGRLMPLARRLSGLAEALEMIEVSRSGVVAEWFKAAVLKTAERATVP